MAVTQCVCAGDVSLTATHSDGLEGGELVDVIKESLCLSQQCGHVSAGQVLGARQGLREGPPGSA